MDRLPSRSRRARGYDVAIVLSASVIAVLMLRGSPPLLRPLGGATLVVQLALAVTLLLRRRAPVAVAWIMVAAAGAAAVCEAVVPGSLVPENLEGNSYPWLPAAAPFAATAATAYGGRRGLVPAAALVLVASHFWAQPDESPWLLQGVIFAGGPALVGLYVGERRRLVESLVERTERAEREQYLLAEQARADERARLAAEMHDLVTHRVSLMVLEAGALQVTAADERTRAAADRLRETGCDALAELRDLIGILREAPDDRVPDDRAPDGLAIVVSGGAPVGELAELVRGSGVRAELVENGDPDRVSPVVGRTTYRVVQEALTNIRKHAPGADAAVRVTYRPDGVQLTVRNGPPTAQPDAVLVGSGSGVGLDGLRQRVELLDGELEAGPEPGGGFLVEARLPAYVPNSGLPA